MQSEHMNCICEYFMKLCLIYFKNMVINNIMWFLKPVELRIIVSQIICYFEGNGGRYAEYYRLHETAGTAL